MKEAMVELIKDKKCKCLSLKERDKILKVLNGNFNS